MNRFKKDEYVNEKQNQSNFVDDKTNGMKNTQSTGDNLFNSQIENKSTREYRPEDYSISSGWTSDEDDNKNLSNKSNQNDKNKEIKKDNNQFKIPEIPRERHNSNSSNISDSSFQSNSNVNQSNHRNYNYNNRNYCNNRNNYNRNNNYRNNNNNRNNNYRNNNRNYNNKIDEYGSFQTGYKRGYRRVNKRFVKNYTRGNQNDQEYNTSFSEGDSQLDPIDDESTEDEKIIRKQEINRNLHNQKTYYDQKNNIESDEINDILSDFDSSKASSLDTKMKELVKLFIESFIPFNLIHGSYFSNLVRSRFSIRKMPKLIQMKEFFLIMSELARKYIVQTMSGSQSYTLCFHFWKTTNRRHQFLTIRASYIDVFIRRSPVLTCFKVFPDYSSEDYQDKINHLFRRFKLDRNKVFSVVTNFRARSFITALDTYIGSDKIIYCLIHQLNNKFNEILLNYDYEQDKVHYEQKLEELEVFNEEEKNDDSEKQYFSDDYSDNLNDDQNDHYKNDDNQNNNYLNDDTYDDLSNYDEKDKQSTLDQDEQMKILNPIEDDENDDDCEEETDEIDDKLAYIKLIEEANDIFKTLNETKLDELPYTVRIIKSLIKTFAFITADQNLLDKLNKLTKSKNGQEFEPVYLLSYKNWNYLFRFFFYLRDVKNEFQEFIKQNSTIPFDLNKDDFKLVNDIFEILALITKKMNFLSLEEQVGLGKSMKIMRSFIYSFNKLEMKSEEGVKLKDKFLLYFKTKHGIYERDNYVSIANLLDPKCSNFDFKSDRTFDEAIKNLHEILCFRLDKQFNLALYAIRAPLRIELENFHRNRPYRAINDITKFQLNSPVLQGAAYDYLTIPAICMSTRQIDYDTNEKIIGTLSQIRRDTLSKILLLNSLDQDLFDKIIDYAKFW